ncbi:Acyl-CoA synthetase short-chain member 3, mitochondrial, partial [Actinomortierella ambigua]
MAPSSTSSFASHPQAVLHDYSLQKPAEFWAQYARMIDWDTPYSAPLTRNPDGSHTWFKDGRLNTCFNAIDRHVKNGRGGQVALYYDSPLNKGEKRQITYQQLLEEVQTFAGVLADHGVAKGDVVLIYMPMVPEALISMLACARLGVTHS